MKTIGMIGGMSWESTAIYYQIMNRYAAECLGGLNSAKCLLYSVNFEDVQHLQHLGKWEELTTMMLDAAQTLERAGADLLMVCTNTMHRMASEIEQAVQIPFLHIADPTAEAIKQGGLKKVGLLATRFTMEQDFYLGRLREKHGLDVVVPNADERTVVHEIIYQELCRGIVRESSRDQYLHILQRLVDQGAEGIILGCTEITMLISPADCPVPAFDTTGLHARQAVDWALAD